MTGFYYGLIEGFYGRQWSWTERCSMAGFLADHGYDCYVYAPKGDAALRSGWRESFSEAWLKAIVRWGEHCRQRGLRWGLGLSPLGLQSGYGDAERRALQSKMQEIQRLNPDILWILFDDMRGDTPALAANQCAVLNDVRSVFSGALAMCPSYYSFDSRLDEVFGPRPERYLEDLGSGLDGHIDVLWTGESVISSRYTQGDCQRVTEMLQRKPVIWDNYPVNDGRITSNFLHLDAFRGRPWQMQDWTGGHMINPMNQAYLSQLPLATLQALYAERSDYAPDNARQKSFQTLPPPLSRLLERDWHRFQYQGLSSLPLAERTRVLGEYQACDHPAAHEVCQWLQGQYEFDPACLTD